MKFIRFWSEMRFLFEQMSSFHQIFVYLSFVYLPRVVDHKSVALSVSEWLKICTFVLFYHVRPWLYYDFSELKYSGKEKKKEELGDWCLLFLLLTAEWSYCKMLLIVSLLSPLTLDFVPALPLQRHERCHYLEELSRFLPVHLSCWPYLPEHSAASWSVRCVVAGNALII